jgi:hypothetical protein
MHQLSRFALTLALAAMAGAAAAAQPSAANHAPATKAATPSTTFGGLWWNSPAGSESGWGINLNHQGDTIFATWFTFDEAGLPLWMVIAATRTADNVYSGTLYRGTGPGFNAPAFDSSKVKGAPAGTATFTFVDGTAATFAFTVGNVTRSKTIVRQQFASPVPTCTWGGTTNPAAAINYQDIWWASPPGSESGWGINLAHQGDTIFASWFTYDTDGKAMWFVVSAVKSAPGVYGGRLFTGTGPPYSAATFAADKVKPLDVGAASFTFADGNRAAFTWTVDGIGTQTKQITREVITAPGAVCQ